MGSLRRVALYGLAIAGTLLGTTLIYGFGAGYYGAFHAPTPWNYPAAAALLALLVWMAWAAVRSIDRQ